MARVKKLLDSYERTTRERLVKACEKWGVDVLQKVRVADVVELDGSGVDNATFKYGLLAHFDFVVCQDDFPKFAIEFDGDSHRTVKQKARDEKKNNICKVCEFPLLRINSKYLQPTYRGYALLSWCVDYFFLQEGLLEAQEAGQLPPDEDFEPSDVIAMPGKARPFPMWLSVEPREHFRRLQASGRCRDAVPSFWIGTDSGGNYRGLMWICLDESTDQWVWVESGVKAQNFPVRAGELISEILVFDLAATLDDVLAGIATPCTGGIVGQAVARYRRSYSARRAGGVARKTTE